MDAILPEKDSSVQIAVSDDVNFHSPLFLDNSGTGGFELDDSFLAAFTKMNEIWVTTGLLCHEQGFQQLSQKSKTEHPFL